MIRAIEGTVTKLEPTYIWIKTNFGVSYGVSVSVFSASKLKLNETKELFITQIIREDADLLFGFLEKDEQEIFEMLLKVSGIGPSTAMAVCSGMTPNSVKNAVLKGDVNAFKQVPGIGPKTAKLLIATLSDEKFGSAQVSDYQSQAILALESLGYKKEIILKALKDTVSKDTASLVKELLQKLYKG